MMVVQVEMVMGVIMVMEVVVASEVEGRPRWLIWPTQNMIYMNNKC